MTPRRIDGSGRLIPGLTPPVGLVWATKKPPRLGTTNAMRVGLPLNRAAQFRDALFDYGRIIARESVTSTMDSWYSLKNIGEAMEYSIASPPCLGEPHQTEPCRATPCLGKPRPALLAPEPTVKSTRDSLPCRNSDRHAVPRRARPYPASSQKTAPELTPPNLAVPCPA